MQTGQYNNCAAAEKSPPKKQHALLLGLVVPSEPPGFCVLAVHLEVASILCSCCACAQESQERKREEESKDRQGHGHGHGHQISKSNADCEHLTCLTSLNS